LGFNGAAVLSKMTPSILALSIMTLSIPTLSVLTLSITTLIVITVGQLTLNMTFNTPSNCLMTFIHWYSV
jgi:hypothetical protein